MQNKKLVALILSVIMLLSVFPIARMGVMGVMATEANILSNTPVKSDGFAANASGRSAKQVAAGSVYGLRMNYGAPFDAIEVSMPTWLANNSAATLSIYKWRDSYEQTLNAAPIASAVFDPVQDNAFNELRFHEQPAGEYMVTLSNTRGTVGVWQAPATVGMGFAYMDGIESSTDWEMRVSFTKTPAAPFLPCKSTVCKLPAEYETPADSLLNTHKVMPDTWVFTDGLGRVSLTNAQVGDPKEDKTLAMFYWTWHTKETASKGYVNTSELIAKYPEAKNDYNHPAWAGTGLYCFWNEPIYGYYTTQDPWVLRRQAELLANAGVDVIFADNTNGNILWRESYLALYEAWDDAQKNGAVHVPKVSYLFPFAANSDSKEQIEFIYTDIYRSGMYQNLWFYWDGKPMFMGHAGNISKSTPLGAEILNNLTFRGGQISYLVHSTPAGQWGWLSTYPQALYSVYGQSGVNRGQIEQMAVGVAVNYNYITHEITAMNGVNVMGRSYTTDFPNRYEIEGPEASKWGYQFSQQFDYALQVSPPVLFVTGWNEWHAWRQPTPWGGQNSLVNNALVDEFNDEFSRDLEPTKGALQDHYYYLFVNYARQYKGVNPIPAPSQPKAIDLSAGYDQWRDVGPYYAAYIGNTFDRNSTGYGDAYYTETSGRNDIIGAQVTRDRDYLYFLVECAENITPYTDALWMNLYLDTNQENQGWNTFEFVVNKSAASEKTLVLEKFTAENDYAGTEKVADVEYKVDGRYMTVKIPKSVLGVTGQDYTVNFAWTDNVHDEGDYSKFSGDILDFYISGDVAPGGRFKYSYVVTGDHYDELPVPLPTVIQTTTIQTTTSATTTPPPVVSQTTTGTTGATTTQPTSTQPTVTQPTDTQLPHTGSGNSVGNTIVEDERKYAVIFGAITLVLAVVTIVILRKIKKEE